MERLKTIIVDDEVEIAKYLELILQERFGEILELERLTSGTKALEKLKNAPYDLLISDIRMPVTDGFILLDYIIEQNLPTEVILLTAYKEFDYIYRANRDREVKYLVKTEKETEILAGVENLIRKILTEKENRKTIETANQKIQEIAQVMTKGQLSQIGDELDQSLSWMEESQATLEDKNKLCELKDYVKKHSDTDITVANLAKRFHYHPAYLSKIFKHEYQVKLSEYITKYKMREAKRLLRETELFIHEIATRLGYQSSQAFARAFKKEMEITPQEYRRKSGMTNPDDSSF